MNQEQKQRTLASQITLLLGERTHIELAIGYLRYEALRKLNTTQFKYLHQRNSLGENFDEMVDALVAQP